MAFSINEGLCYCQLVTTGQNVNRIERVYHSAFVCNPTKGTLFWEYLCYFFPLDLVDEL